MFLLRNVLRSTNIAGRFEKRLLLKAENPDTQQRALRAWDGLITTHTYVGKLGAAVDEMLMKIEHQLKSPEMVRKQRLCVQCLSAILNSRSSKPDRN